MAITDVFNVEHKQLLRRSAPEGRSVSPRAMSDASTVDYWQDVVTTPISAEKSEQLVKSNAPKRVFREMGLVLTVMVGVVEAAFVVGPFALR